LFADIEREEQMTTKSTKPWRGLNDPTTEACRRIDATLFGGTVTAVILVERLLAHGDDKLITALVRLYNQSYQMVQIISYPPPYTKKNLFTHGTKPYVLLRHFVKQYQDQVIASLVLPEDTEHRIRYALKRLWADK
jgi:hypothetical protein